MSPVPLHERELLVGAPVLLPSKPHSAEPDIGEHPDLFGSGVDSAITPDGDPVPRGYPRHPFDVKQTEREIRE